MKTYDCVHCGARLAEIADGYGLLIAHFPADLGRCCALLERGPGGVFCPRCLKTNVLAMPSVLIDPDQQGIIGLPEQVPRAQVPDDVLRLLAAQAGARETVIAESPREFRRAFLTAHIAPAGSLLNSFLTSDDRLAWIGEHHQQLDDRFWAAMWLTSTGVIEVFTKPLDVGAQPPSAFVPHEEAPDAASHLVKRKETLQQHELNVGQLLGCLLLWRAMRALEAKSLQPLLDRLSTLVMEGAVQQEMLDAAGAAIGRTVDGIDNNAQGWIINTYLCEAALALFAHQHELENPRKRHWTWIVLFYDFMRRRDGNDERYLLDPALLHATVDQPLFWQVCRQIAEKFGLVELTQESEKEFGYLFDAAARVFPEEALAQMALKISTGGEDAVQASVDLIVQQLKDGHDTMLEAALNGVRTRHPDALPAVAHALLGKLDTGLKLSAERRCALYRALIEMLNLMGHHEDARIVAADCVRFMNSPQGAALSRERRAHLLNEIGNRMRYDGDREDALAMYEESLDLLGRDVHDTNVRVALRNRAIILRELHRYTEARQAFAELMPHANMTESRGLITSQAACLMEMGLEAEALSLMESKFALVQGASPESPGVIEQVTLHAALLVQQNKLARARELLGAVREAADQRHYMVTQIVDHMATLRGDGAGKAGAIDGLCGLFGHIQAGQPLDRILLDAIEELDKAMIAAGRFDQAQALIRTLCERTDPEAAPAAWRLHLVAAGHAALTKDSEQEENDLVAAMLHYELGLSHIAARDDVQAFTSPHAEPARALVQRVVQRYERGLDPSGVFMRYAADMRAAPVLSARLRHLADLEPPLFDIEEEEERLVRLLQQTPAVLLQFVAAGDSIVAVRTFLTDGGAIESTMRRLGPGQSAWAQLANRLAFALLKAPASTLELDLGKVRGWAEATAALYAAISDVPAQLPVAVIAGPLHEPLIALALGPARPVCFVPSISALVSLRARHAGAEAPRKLFAFAAWFDREREDEARALADGVQIASGIAQRNGLAADSVTGAQATGEQLLAGLSAAEVAWIACHGRMRPGGVELYVSAQGSLAPADASAIREGLRDPHILRWTQLESMQSASRTVFSSACDSGLAITNPGGERLGLERPLFVAGTATFLAPVWPVPTVAAQGMLSSILDAWLGDPGVALVQHVWRARNAGMAAGEPALACAAFVPFGDAL